MHFFHWHENGELRTTFEWPSVRTGSAPDELNAVMTEVGLNLTGVEAASGLTCSFDRTSSEQSHAAGRR
jgi:hypothetical protein